MLRMAGFQQSSRTAKIMDAMMPLVSQAPRPQMYWSSSREGKNGGTVSIWVDNVTMGSPNVASTLKRRGFDGHSLHAPGVLSRQLR